MKIIMLNGEPDSGKTASLHFVREILVNNGAKTTKVEQIGSDTQRDFSSVLKYKEKSISIFTMGDIEDEDCKKKLQEALFKKFDFLICACNGNDKIIKKKATHLIEKTVAGTGAGRLSANWYDASRIIELLDKSIKQRRKA